LKVVVNIRKSTGVASDNESKSQPRQEMTVT
jgi:hypothetical protein